MFNSGDIIEIKQWDEMKKEFGERHGSIPCLFSFIESMRRFCGKRYTIDKIVDRKVFFVESLDLEGYKFSTDMIKLVKKAKGIEYTDLMID